MTVDRNNLKVRMLFSTAVSYLKFFSCYCLPSRWLSGTDSVPRCEDCWLLTHQHHHTLVQFGSWLTLTAVSCGYPLLHKQSFLIVMMSLVDKNHNLIGYHFLEEYLLMFESTYSSESFEHIFLGVRNRSRSTYTMGLLSKYRSGR